MEIALFAITQSVSVDQQRNTLSLFHVIEELNSPSFPLAVPAFHMAALFVRSADEENAPGGIEFVITHEGRELVRHPTPTNFQGRLRLRTVLEVGGIAVTSPGLMIASVEMRGAQLATWRIVVNSIARPTAQAELGI